MSAAWVAPFNELRRVLNAVQKLDGGGIDTKRLRYAVSRREWDSINRDIQDINRDWRGRIPHKQWETNPYFQEIRILNVPLVIDTRLNEPVYRLKDYEVSG